MEPSKGDFSQKNNVDKVTLFDFDLSARSVTQKDDAQEDLDPLDFIVSTYQVHPHFKELSDHYILEQPFLVVHIRYSINTRAPPLFASA